MYVLQYIVMGESRVEEIRSIAKNRKAVFLRKEAGNRTSQLIQSYKEAPVKDKRKGFQRRNSGY